MRKIVLLSLIAFLAPVLLTGCQPTVAYQDPYATETVNVDFGRTDLQTIANKMINSLLQAVPIQQGQRPVVYFHGVKNKTDEHIDTKNITDKVEVALVQSGRFRVTGHKEVPQELQDELMYQTGSGMVRPDTAVQFGQRIGAQYFLYGEMTSIRKFGGRTEDIYYKFTLKMINIQSGLLEWADEHEISKAERTSLFGM